MSNIKEERIAVRVDSRMYEILKGIADENKMTLSQFVRYILEYFHMQLLLGQITKPYKEVRKEFLDFAKVINQKSRQPK